MSDQDTGQEPIAEPEAQPEVKSEGQEPKADPKVFDESYVKELRSEAAKYRKEAQEAKQREQEREDAEKSELEKAQGKLERTTQELSELQTRLLRSEVADELEVPAKLRPLLTATSKEELESQAKLILENAAPPKNPEFDGGPREVSEEPLSPEAAHNKLIVEKLFGGSST